MRDIITHILNPEKQLRERLFQLLSAIALAEYVVVTLYYIVLGYKMLQIITVFTGGILFAGTVTYTFRSGHIRAGSAVSGLLYFMIYPLTFFQSGGMYGGAPAVFTFALVYVFLVTEKWERFLCMAICVGASAGCFAAAYLNPELLTRHTVLTEHVESILSVFLVVLLLCSLFTFVTVVYKEENLIVQKQKKEIEALNQAQKSFFSNMSHEIRTPVNAIIGFNEMNLREDVSDEVRENSRNIEVASKILLQTVNEILDLSKLETGGMQIISSEYKTTAMLSDIVSMVWLRAKEKGIEFNLKIDPEMPSKLYGDEMRIKQILLNVVTNAVKYTKEGSVTLRISGKKDSEGFTAVYDVTDTGIGIREESIPYLFADYQRVDSENTHKIEGTGLGLSIVKQLLDLMGGSVTVESEYGKGSTFHIEIPQQITDETPVGEAASENIKNETYDHQNKGRTEQAVSDISGIRILAVDDTPMNLMVIRKLLRDKAAVIDTAASGSEALVKTAESHYDMILMDHQMPEMDGIECLHRIKDQQDGRCRDSKVLCLTANVGADMEKLYLDEGFDGYLSKPVRGRTLEEAIRRHLP